MAVAKKGHVAGYNRQIVVAGRPGYRRRDAVLGILPAAHCCTLLDIAAPLHGTYRPQLAEASIRPKREQCGPA